MTAGRLRSLAAVVVAASTALGAAACTRPTDEFCEVLSTRRGLDELGAAIARRDEPAIRRELADLRELERTAPPELLDDVRTVLDTVSETVRAVTEVEVDDPDAAPVDLTALNDRLASVQPAAQRLTDFADRNCRVDL